MDFIAGVDGGGTKTKVVCASPEGKVLDTAVFGPFNMNSIGAERFSALLQELCAYLNGLGDCRALCIGSAGISNKEMTRIVEMEMTRGGIENWNLVGDQVIAAIERRNEHGDFRANIEHGGVASAYFPTAQESALALAACRALGLDFGGVDLLEAEDGSMVCEVNSNAHFAGLLSATGVNPADHIMQYIRRTVCEE